ncbi:hypothetical protein K2Z83_11240 [Oscillochloris sp. ZM17-4]|uniref:hypothetical protein n=1 Tax=Oscillochloris sp. ZM17-4 TaxID=2866714 RepID=UPI001C72A7EF|nr:hypothetical protein [Oscillochloris sp. ZM17-4]MBX0328251.1 hypothetical protein [Oscillochloris sp. ZM17-4]
MTTLLIAGDAGNRKLKFRDAGENWIAEDALVRHPTRLSDDLGGAALRPLTYLEGPAGIDYDERGKPRRRPFLLGVDAQRAGGLDQARIGTAQVRVESDAYKLQHLYMLARSLPRSLTHDLTAGRRWKPKDLVEVEAMFAGGLPGEDAVHKPALLAWLRGKSAHRFTLGETEFRIRVAGALIIPQHLAATCSLTFSATGAPIASGALQRKRLMLESGGGTTDYGGSVGLDIIPGTEGSVRKGAIEIATLARDFIMGGYPGLQLSVLDVLAAMDQGEPTVFIRGTPTSVRRELQQAADIVATAILTDVTPKWEAHLSQAEVNLAGGTGQWILSVVQRELGQIAPVALLDDAIFRVGWGLERLARHRMQAAQR